MPNSPVDLLRSILFFNTAHGTFTPDEYYATVQIMIERAIASYPNLLQDTDSLEVASVVAAVVAMRNSTYSLFLLFHLIPDTPSLTKACLNHCHDQTHTLRFIDKLTQFKTKEFDGPSGWRLFGESSPFTGRTTTRPAKPDPLALGLEEPTNGRCEFDTFVQMCRTLWLNTMTTTSQQKFSQANN